MFFFIFCFDWTRKQRPDTENIGGGAIDTGARNKSQFVCERVCDGGAISATLHWRHPASPLHEGPEGTKPSSGVTLPVSPPREGQEGTKPSSDLTLRADAIAASLALHMATGS